MGLTTEIVRAPELPAPMRDAMFGLYEAHYDAATRDNFLSDLADKTDALLIRDQQGELCGFTTLSVTRSEYEGAELRAIFSGDTVMHRDHWGHQSLAFNWIRFAGSIKAREPELPLYWFLITKGPRTYRYLSAFSCDFFPHWQHPTPPHVLGVMRSLARRRFGSYFDERNGIIHFPVSRGHLRADLARVSPAESRRTDVRFFLERNPGYVGGDELVCITELASQNLKPIARRLFAQSLSR